MLAVEQRWIVTCAPRTVSGPHYQKKAWLGDGGGACKSPFVARSPHHDGALVEAGNGGARRLLEKERLGLGLVVGVCGPQAAGGRRKPLAQPGRESRQRKRLGDLGKGFN